MSEAPATPQVSALSPQELDDFTSKLVTALKTVYDPEIPVDIYELGLIYKVDLDDNRHLTIDMTLTAPGCPVAGEMPGKIRFIHRYRFQTSAFRFPFETQDAIDHQKGEAMR